MTQNLKRWSAFATPPILGVSNQVKLLLQMIQSQLHNNTSLKVQKHEPGGGEGHVEE